MMIIKPIEEPGSILEELLEIFGLWFYSLTNLERRYKPMAIILKPFPPVILY